VDYCGLVDDDMDYAAYNLHSIRNVTSATKCCSSCQRNPECRAWTWGKARNVMGLTNVCYLKGLAPGYDVKKMENEQTMSGLPYRLPASGEVSLFCFSPILAEDKASQLLTFQYRQGAGIFGCEEHAIYSAQPLELTPGVACTVVHAENCGDGADADPCGPPSVYLAVWKKVVAEGRFRYHTWTVKVRPNAVFIAYRLKGMLASVFEPESGLYFSSCMGGLQAPVTIMSRIAIQAFGLGISRCVEGGDGGVSAEGGAAGGDFVHQCLSQVLKVEHRTDPGLLADSSCQSTDTMSCGTEYVAYSPLVSTDDYAQCLSAAGWVMRRAPLDTGSHNKTSEDGAHNGSNTAEE